MRELQNTLISALYKIRKAGLDLVYPISDERLELVITKLLEKNELHCKVKPRVRSKKLKKHGILENTSTVVDMILVHPNTNGTFSSPTSVSLYFDSYLTEEDIPEFSISGRFNNKYKEAIYRPKQVETEDDVICYVNTILDDLSHNKMI